MSALITGIPGSGKTLFAITHVEALTKLPENVDRPVYYHGIAELNLPWLLLDDPTTWPTLPTGSIILIDEAQKFFRPISSNSPVPRHVSELETHRHNGFDIFLITQHPTLINKSVHRLVNEHFHLVRKFGYQVSTIHMFYEVREHPDKYRVGSVATVFKFPKRVYALYKSAEKHTRKGKLPGRVKLLLVLPLVLFALVFYTYKWFNETYMDNPGVGKEATKGLIKKPSFLSGSSTPSAPPASPTEAFLTSMNPVIPGLAYTAPAYAEIVKPVAAPAPVACVSGKSRCSCYTEQGTRLPDVSESTCLQIVENGFFVAWQKASPPLPPPGGVGGGAQAEARPPPLLAAAPVMLPASEPQQVAVIARPAPLALSPAPSTPPAPPRAVGGFGTK